MSSEQDKEAQKAARAAFPRGLAQPEGSFRFSMDALLAAAYLEHIVSMDAARRAAAPNAPQRLLRLLDLGTGCGAAAFAVLLRLPEVTATGVDISPELLEAARHNAALLGVANRFTTQYMDLCAHGPTDDAPDQRAAADPACGRRGQKTGTSGHNEMEYPLPQGIAAIQAGSFDLVLANPPYHTKESGRRPAHALRERALFGFQDTLAGFCRAAAYALKHRGRMIIVFPAGRLAELTAAMQRFTLGPRRLRAVHSRADAPAKLVLVMGQKNAAADLVLEPPLIVYDPNGDPDILSRTAQEFCPFLQKR